jgi:hypothetical protein
VPVVGPADGDAVGHGRLFGRWSSNHRIRHQATPARLLYVRDTLGEKTALTRKLR